MAPPIGRLHGKVALVTGASSGIGAATARLFAREGAQVAATGRNSQALAALVEEITAAGGTAAAFPGDAADDKQVREVVEQTVRDFGGLDVLVNNAGVLRGGAVGAGGMEAWDANMAVNARGAYCFLECAVPHLKGSSAASVVFVTSVNAMQSFAGVAAYCASKAAADMIMRCASVDLAPFGIRVNSVNPGVVVTELQRRGGMGDEAYEAFLKRSVDVTHPLGAALGRPCAPEEVAESILFLASPQASYITGSNLSIDGGRRNLGAR